MAKNGLASEDDGAWVRALEVMSMLSVPMALQAAVKLQVLEILGCENRELSASEIIARMKDTYKFSISNPAPHLPLDRILRVLASHGVLSSSLQEPPPPHVDDQLPVRTYGITAVGRYFVGHSSLGAFNLMTLLPPFMDAWQLLDQSVLQGPDAFSLAHGQSTFLFGQAHPPFAHSFNAGMTNLSNLFMPFLLRSYDGFLSVNTLVDVGGGTGACLRMIISRYPHIKGINFDLPHVVATSPPHAGVEHVGGDMFKSIPKADAIFMKTILHNWSDKLCVEILKTCYKALPKNGKVIVVDMVLSPRVETTPITCLQYKFDLAMLAFFKDGKERTQHELQGIAKAAGFGRFHIITQVHDTSIVELHKD